MQHEKIEGYEIANELSEEQSNSCVEAKKQLGDAQNFVLVEAET